MSLPMMAVIPAPLQTTLTTGEFRFRAGTRIKYADEMLAPIVTHFCRDLARRTGLATDPARGAGDGPSVRVELGHHPDVNALPKPFGISPAGDVAPDERYALTIDDGSVVVRGVKAVGAARGLTTLLQLLATSSPDSDGTVALPAARMLDAPRFAWRGLLLDVARTFFTVDEVKRVIDLLALYKLNVLHLHLTDDQAWRIEAGRPPNSGEAGELIYTSAEFRDLIKYADEQFVTLVPEVDTPGHASAILRLRPELTTGRNVLDHEPTAFTAGHSVWLDPDLAATYEVIEEVLSQVANLFPGPFLHIGGDEPFGMPEDLYGAYVRHVIRFVRSIGKRTVGFQETMRAGVDPNHVIQYWISPDTEAMVNIGRARADIEQAKARGVRIIVTPMSHAYLDVAYAEPSADPSQEAIRLRVGQRVYSPKTVAETFDWEPVEALGPNTRPEHLAGVGAAIWCETIHEFDELTFQLLPRLAGSAHKAWGDPRTATWDEHRQALASHGQLWAQDDLAYFKSSTVDWDPDPACRSAADHRSPP